MKNRIRKNKDEFEVDNGTNGGSFVNVSWHDGKIEVRSCGRLPLTHKTIRELTKWLADTQIQHQTKGTK